MRLWFQRLKRSNWLAPVLLGALLGLVVLIIVLLIRSPRDTVVLEVVPQSRRNAIEVWVGGEVGKPGLYTLERGSRVADAVAAAGGVTENGNATGLGMAAPLEDADQIVIPRARSTAPPRSTADGTPTEAGSGDDAPTAVGSGRVNINTANAAGLETLNGIGPVIASRIIEYRQSNGPFQSLDELAAVSGISDRMVDELRPRMTIGR